MDYSLAKQLKDAGFPQTEQEELYDFVVDDPNIPEEDWELFNNPTLSDLIEACGDIVLHGPGTKDVNEEYMQHPPDVWTAYKEVSWQSCYLNVTGKTPEEAVALLYLKLNDKS